MKKKVVFVFVFVFGICIFIYFALATRNVFSCVWNKVQSNGATLFLARLSSLLIHSSREQFWYFVVVVVVVFIVVVVVVFIVVASTNSYIYLCSSPTYFISLPVERNLTGKEFQNKMKNCYLSDYKKLLQLNVDEAVLDFVGFHKLRSCCFCCCC